VPGEASRPTFTGLSSLFLLPVAQWAIELFRPSSNRYSVCPSDAAGWGIRYGPTALRFPGGDLPGAADLPRMPGPTDGQARLLGVLRPAVQCLRAADRIGLHRGLPGVRSKYLRRWRWRKRRDDAVMKWALLCYLVGSLLFVAGTVLALLAEFRR
jgi:hypothetical protein